MTSTSLQFTCRLPESCDFVATTTIILSATQNGDFAGLLFTKYGTSKTHMYINPFSPAQDKHQVPNYLFTYVTIHISFSGFSVGCCIHEEVMLLSELKLVTDNLLFRTTHTLSVHDPYRQWCKKFCSPEYSELSVLSSLTLAPVHPNLCTLWPVKQAYTQSKSTR